MKNDRRILLTTAYRQKKKTQKGDTYDYAEVYMKSRFLRVSLPRDLSYGLRFIKQNIPEIQILEYPFWSEYCERIAEGWDVVGFSFYLNETHEVLEMIKHARENGVDEIWGGNYGVMTGGMDEHFDQIFTGYAEQKIADKIGEKVDRIIHPPLIKWIGFNVGPKLFAEGVLFTSRGCNFRCAFCQTPAFCDKPSKVPLDSIEDVLEYYARKGVRDIVTTDESFGMFPKHTEKVVSILGEMGFYWRCMTNASILDKNLEFWSENGMCGARVGIENFSQHRLDSINKPEKIEEVIDIVERLNNIDKTTLIFYMIGFEDETADSIREDILKLAELPMDMAQICIVTPLPGTPLWDEIEQKYGIFETDWHNYDLHHLVWNHPNITPKEMHELLDWSLRTVHSATGVLRGVRKIWHTYKNGEGSSFKASKYILKSMLKANSMNYFLDQIPLIEK